MRTKLADFINQQADNLKENQYLERMTGVPANFGIIGRQYGRRSDAMRAIRNFRVKHFPTYLRGYQMWVNKIDEGCVEICGIRS